MATLAACAYRGGDIGDPLVRKFHWFSFVEGEDIRADCRPGLPDRFRLVYNGIYDEQLRIYEWDSARRLLVERVSGPGNVAGIRPDDPLGSWRAREERVQLDGPAYERLERALDASGAFGPPAVGLDLPARSYFWTAATCRGGRYAFTGWRHPSPEFDRLAFPQPLLALDMTGIPMRMPAPVPFDPQWEAKRRQNEVVDFTLKVGESGLAGFRR